MPKHHWKHKQTFRHVGSLEFLRQELDGVLGSEKYYIPILNHNPAVEVFEFDVYHSKQKLTPDEIREIQDSTWPSRMRSPAPYRFRATTQISPVRDVTRNEGDGYLISQLRAQQPSHTPGACDTCINAKPAVAEESTFLHPTSNPAVPHQHQGTTSQADSLTDKASSKNDGHNELLDNLDEDWFSVNKEGLPRREAKRKMSDSWEVVPLDKLPVLEKDDGWELL
ncbi:hypothetical protein B0T26DRAFT_754000 [Lasiosphaeria miniovina]|uniref:Uncharacterized protein n=1 Tax=Lasiosphaeria miniovina TaxID=1954250 RepID=A0AA40DW52_9PEZI|nr:uncharacterized protein B0T26DRAFT_754000 [Lasiosphaeria miniovina]KAK0713943.1 hypothetical protein B0T26DRAFT_754000 [Lasiosphaeria miniovina]